MISWSCPSCAFVIFTFSVLFLSAISFILDPHVAYSLSSGKGEIIICALCVPGFIIQGWFLAIGMFGKPVDSDVAQGKYTT